MSHGDHVTHVSSGRTVNRDLTRNVVQSLSAARAYLNVSQISLTMKHTLISFFIQRQPGRFHVQLAGSTQTVPAQLVPLVLHWSPFGTKQYMIIDCVQ